MSTAVVIEEIPATPVVPARHGLGRFIRQEPLGAIALLFILVLVLLAIFAPTLAPADPTTQHRQNFLEAPSASFLMGTDDLGRDVLSRVLYGARVSLLVGFVTVAATLVIGSTIGMMSALAPSRVDAIVQRFMDVLLTIPAIVLLLFVAALLGASVRNTIIALTIVISPQINRIARSEVLRIKQERYIEAARSTGAGFMRVLVVHALPNMTAALLTIGSLQFANVIIAEASLSFLGIGTPPPTPSWGLMISESMRYMQAAPWMVMFPGLFLSASVFAFNFLGDALRDFFDPTLRR